MSGFPDWTTWLLAVAVIALFAWFFWHTARSIWGWFVRMVRTIQTWPQTRRAMVEAEVRAGGRYPFWLRAARVLIVLFAVALVAYIIYRRLQ